MLQHVTDRDMFSTNDLVILFSVDADIRFTNALDLLFTIILSIVLIIAIDIFLLVKINTVMKCGHLKQSVIRYSCVELFCW